MVTLDIDRDGEWIQAEVMANTLAASKARPTLSNGKVQVKARNLIKMNWLSKVGASGVRVGGSANDAMPRWWWCA